MESEIQRVKALLYGKNYTERQRLDKLEEAYEAIMKMT